MTTPNLLRGTFLALTTICLTGLSNCAATGSEPASEVDGRESAYDKETDYQNAVRDEITELGGLGVEDEEGAMGR